MILGIGIDIIETHRFEHWQQYSDEKLMRIFSKEEIHYCKTIPAQSAARFAARFALREAAYKAYSTATHCQSVSFLRFCRAVTITHSAAQAILLTIDFKTLGISPESITTCASISHSKSAAAAVVVLSQAKA